MTQTFLSNPNQPIHFIPYFRQEEWDDNHSEVIGVVPRVHISPEPTLITCGKCLEYIKAKGITKRIDNTEPIDMDIKIVKSPWDTL